MPHIFTKQVKKKILSKICTKSAVRPPQMKENNIFTIFLVNEMFLKKIHMIESDRG